MLLEDRIAALELRVGRLERPDALTEDLRVAPERPASVAPPAPRPVVVIPAPRPAPAAAKAAPAARRPAPKRKRDPIELEDFLGGRVLAWLGGAAVIAGLAFMLTVAISRGWIGESARTGLAALLSTALLIGGARLREKRVRNDAALAAAAAGVAGLFGTLVVAGQVYDLIPLLLAVPLALAVGAAATALAIRWRAQVMGWLGLVGALLAPAVLGDHGGIAFLAVAYGATVAVLVWQRWTPLMYTAYALVTLQWLVWMFQDRPSSPLVVVTLTVFGLLTAAAAVGFELRRREAGVRDAAMVLLIVNAIVIDAAGWILIDDSTGPVAAGLWLAVVAAGHLAIGLAGRRIPRVSPELSLIALGLGVILADVAFAALASGLPLVLGWAATTVGFGALLRRAHSENDRAFALAGLGGHLLAALTHALTIDVPAAQLLGGNGGAEAVVAIAAAGAAAALAGRVAHRLRSQLDIVALAALAYATALTLDGVPLTLALAGEAVALAAVARKERDAVASYGALAFFAIALAHLLGVVAPPLALRDGLSGPWLAVGALLTVTGAAVLVARAPFGRDEIALALRAVAAALVAYLAALLLDGVALAAAWTVEAVVLTELARYTRAELASAGAVAMAGATLTLALLAAAPPGALIGGLDHPLEALGALVAGLAAVLAASRAPFGDPRVVPALHALAAVTALYLASTELVTFTGAAAQTALSVLWASAGVGTLVAGLVTDRPRLRQGALALLALTAAKVFVYDLASLDSMARVGSLVGMGLLLLAGAFSWQRVRPRTMPDLREAGADAR